MTRVFPGSSKGKESACNEGDPGLIIGENLEKGMAIHSSILVWRIPWQAAVHQITKNQTRLSN